MAGYNRGRCVIGAAMHRWKQTTLDTSRLNLNEELFMLSTTRQTIGAIANKKLLDGIDDRGVLVGDTLRYRQGVSLYQTITRSTVSARTRA